MNYACIFLALLLVLSLFSLARLFFQYRHVKHNLADYQKAYQFHIICHSGKLCPVFTPDGGFNWYAVELPVSGCGRDTGMRIIGKADELFPWLNLPKRLPVMAWR